MFRRCGFPHPEAESYTSSLTPLPRPRVVGSTWRSGGFVRGSDIPAPGSSEILSRAWTRSRGLVSISLVHLFRKEEGLDNTTTSLAGSSRGVH
jgi:hypothetical protein